MKYTIERRIVSKTGMTNCGWKLGIGFDRRKVTIKKKAWCVLEEGKVIAECRNQKIAKKITKLLDVNSNS